MYERSISFEKAKEQYQVSLAEKDREIEKLNVKLKAANEDIEFHKSNTPMSLQQVFSMKNGKNLEYLNVITIPKGSKKSMIIDFKKNLEIFYWALTSYSN